MAQSVIDAIEAVKNGRRTNQIRTSKNHKKAKMLLKTFGIRAAGLFALWVQRICLIYTKSRVFVALHQKELWSKGLCWLIYCRSISNHDSIENERTVIALGERVTLKRIPAGARKNVSRLWSCANHPCRPSGHVKVFCRLRSPPPKRGHPMKHFLRTNNHSTSFQTTTWFRLWSANLTGTFFFARCRRYSREIVDVILLDADSDQRKNDDDNIENKDSACTYRLV